MLISVLRVQKKNLKNVSLDKTSEKKWGIYERKLVSRSVLSLMRTMRVCVYVCVRMFVCDMRRGHTVRDVTKNNAHRRRIRGAMSLVSACAAVCGGDSAGGGGDSGGGGGGGSVGGSGRGGSGRGSGSVAVVARGEGRARDRQGGACGVRSTGRAVGRGKHETSADRE